MMKIVFDGTCAPCSRIGQAIDAMGNDEIAAVSSSDDSIRKILARNGISECPNEPVLIVDENGNSEHILRGIRMRIALAKKVGWRNASRLVGLAIFEQQARYERQPSTTRRVILSAAGAVGISAIGAVLPLSGARATDMPRQLSKEDAAALLSGPLVAEAVRKYGPVVKSEVTTFGRNEKVVTLFHDSRGKVISVTGYPLSPQDQVLTGTLQGDGSFLFRDAKDRNVFVLSVKDDAFQLEFPSGHVSPDTTTGQIYCATACMIEYDIGGECLSRCLNCAEASDLANASFWCTLCGACAGPAAYKCFKRCLSKA